MFAGNVYYCWSCDAHCRAVEESAEGACCPRCHEHLAVDSKLDGESVRRPFYALHDSSAKQEPASKRQAGLWAIRSAAMH